MANNETALHTGCVDHLPTETGIDSDLVQLCATISGATYTGDSKEDFRTILHSNESIRKSFPDVIVRFYQNGVTIGKNSAFGSVSLNAPTFTAVTTADTLILAWRGSVTIADFVKDASIASVGPWEQLPGLEVQESYFDLIQKSYFRYHYKDIINYVLGTYSQVPNQTAKDGRNIRRIILTGHSLGGGIAQVAHFCLCAPIKSSFGQTLWKDLVEVIQSHQVDVKTVSFSAPMTTVLRDETMQSETMSFLTEKIFPNMCNIIFKTDVVPRGYANVNFITDFANAFGKELQAGTGIAALFAEAFVNFANRASRDVNGSILKQATLYHHVGRIIYYSSKEAQPKVYVDHSAFLESGGTDFRSLRYEGAPASDIAEYEIQNHMFLVTGPGLCFP